MKLLALVFYSAKEVAGAAYRAKLIRSQPVVRLPAYLPTCLPTYPHASLLYNNYRNAINCMLSLTMVKT